MESQQQKCKVCGRTDKFNYNLPDEIWTKVVPQVYINKVVCLDCFDELAAKRGINYAGFLQRVYFAGSQASFELQVIARSD